MAIVGGYNATMNVAIYLSTGTGFNYVAGPARTIAGSIEWAYVDVMRVVTGDFNGDGLTDLAALEGRNTTASMSFYLSTGTGFRTPFYGAPQETGDTSEAVLISVERLRIADYDGDGKSDVATLRGWGSSDYVDLFLSTGRGMNAAIDGPYLRVERDDYSHGSLDSYRVDDFDGDGRADFLRTYNYSTSTPMLVFPATGSMPDLLASVSNGIGGTTRLAYGSSRSYANTELPYPVQLVKSLSVDDGNGKVATTTYSYEGGFAHLGERDFRGFSHVTALGAIGPGGERQRRETWFHQGNGDPANPRVSTGHMKGKPYLTRVTDVLTGAYRETAMTYWADADGVAPFVTPVRRVVGSNCSATGTCARTTRTDYGYDAYGNVIREDQYGALDDPGDDRTVIREFSANESAWLVAFPKSEAVYEGTFPASSITTIQALQPSPKVAQTDFYYDEVTSCAVASTTRTPTRGHVTRVVSWLNGGAANPETRSAYNAGGTLLCRRDPNGYETAYAYDATGTFLTRTTNAASHVTQATFYGVNGVALVGGTYGQVRTVTDANLVTTERQYDAFGRPLRVNGPGSRWTAWSYSPLAEAALIGTQKESMSSSDGSTTWTYFDGLRRPIRQRVQAAPGGRVKVVNTEYNSSGTVLRTSLPYFEGLETPRWSWYTYDDMGRVIATLNPDGGSVRTCYDDLSGVTGSLDAAGHKRRETRDPLGRVVRIDEYADVYASCSTAEGTPFATTRYAFDRMNRVFHIMDAKGSPTEIAYDTLGRRISLSDPALGDWAYGYDLAGNLAWQRDARGELVTFRYDALHRRVARRHADVTEDTYVYDDPNVAYSKGRLTKVYGASSTTAYTFDEAGQVTAVARAIDGTWYTTKFQFGSDGRIATMTYPDGASITYEYADGMLRAVKGASYVYATFEDYNAAGQPLRIRYGNSVVTDFTYDQNRIKRILTGSTTTLVDLSYDEYDAQGLLKRITDRVDPANSQAIGYDALARLVSVQRTDGSQSFAYDQVGNIVSKEGVALTYDPIRTQTLATVAGVAFQHDANGNLVFDGMRSYSWDRNNRLAGVTWAGGAASFTYDADGVRLTKTTPAGKLVYVDDVYECETPTPGGRTCRRTVFGAGMRIASIRSGDEADVRYYHADHLGSARVITGQAGQVLARMRYRAFGQVEPVGSPTVVRDLFTSQELDAETGLYHYGARYYSPSLGRFISPDSASQDPSDPQLLNRYAYGRNNPVMMSDPNGHFVQFIIAGMVIGAIVGGTGGDLDFSEWSWEGAAAGAVIGGISSAAGFGVGTWVTTNFGGGWVSVAAGGVAGGAAGGATGGALSAAYTGQDPWKGAAMGALYGAIAGGVSAGLVQLKVPNLIATSAGGAASGLIECGGRCAATGAAYAAAGLLASNTLTMMGVGQDGRVGDEQFRELQAEAASRPDRAGATAVTTPKLAWGDWLWVVVALFGNGYSHTWHAGDHVIVLEEVTHGYVPDSDHYYKIIQRNVAWPGQHYALDGWRNFAFLSNNCTTRFNYLSPAMYSSAYGQFSIGAYWLGW